MMRAHRCPRRKYTHVCVHPHCRREYHPFNRQQRYCSESCRASHWQMTVDPVKRQAWSQKGQRALQAKRWKAIAAKLKDCKTLGEAYRLGRKDGYLAGYARRMREERQVRKWPQSA